AMTVSLYLLMYLMMYAAAIRLRYSQPEVDRHFRVPGGKLGMWLIAGFGFVAVAFALVVSFFPPSQVPVGSPGLYTGLVIGGLIVFGAAPFLIHARKRPEWKQHAVNKQKT
ncbi:MAG: amino acid permease, partial [Rhodobacteraceae bacterium]|nr:amino acid permease [Paracoccaceae bacterium]